MTESKALLIKIQCPKCGEQHEILIPSHKINKYLNSKDNVKSFEYS